MKPRTPGSAERIERRLEAEKKKKALAKQASRRLEPAAPPPVAFRRRASLALRQVIVSGTETALKVRTGGLVQDFLRRDEEAGRLLGDDANRCLIDSSGSDDDAVKDSSLTASPSDRKGRRQGIFADRSFWRRARQIACFEYTCERLRNHVNTFWKERLADKLDGLERARMVSKEIFLIVCRFRGLQEAVNRQCELLAFRRALRDRREAEAALTTKLHRQFRAGENGPHAFWSIYHKEDSKWMLPAPSSMPGQQEESELYRAAYNRQLPDAKLVTNVGAQESESTIGHNALKSKRSQAARKVIQHRRDINQKRLPIVNEVSHKPRPQIPEADDVDLDSRPATRQERGYFDLGRFLEPSRRASKRVRGPRPGSRSVPMLPQLGSRERSRQGTRGMSETVSSATSSGSGWWNPGESKPQRRVMTPLPEDEETSMSISRSLPNLAQPALRMPPFSLEAVAEPFLQPWQSEVRTQTGKREPEAEEDSATMHYIRVCNATGVVPTAAVLDMVRSHAISSGSEFLLDDELLAMSTMIRHLDRIKEVCLAGSTQLSDTVLYTFLQKLFGRPAMDSLEKLDLARCRGAGPRATATIVSLLVETRGLYKLRHLDISGIKISSNTLTSLCSAVHLHPAIRCLRLQDTGLGHHPAAASCLQDVLNAPSLEVLGLGWNSFSEEALQSLGDMLASHKRLRELHLPNCDCRALIGSQPSMHVFLEGLGRNSSLTMLDLSMNRLTSTSALILEDSLAKHSKLQELYVGQNPFGVHGLRCLLRLLGQPSCGLRMLEAVGCQGTSDESRFSEGHCGYRASEPSGHYKLDLSLSHARSLLRLLYKTCEAVNLDFNQAFQQLVAVPSPASPAASRSPAKFQHPTGKVAGGVYPVPTDGILSFFFCLNEARSRMVPEAEGLDGKFRGPRQLASMYIDRHFARLRRKLSIRKVVPLLAHFRSLKSRSDEQQLVLDALSTDFTLEYEFVAQIGEDSFNGIDAMVSLLPGVHRSQLRLFLALTHLPRLREYIKVYKRCERLLVFNADCPTGRYALNLTQPSDFAVAEMLKMLDAWESAVARAKGLEDRSKYSNWSSVRNCMHQSAVIRSLSEWILPCTELLSLDFVTWRRPAKDAIAFPADRWDEMMVQLSQAPLQQEAKVHVLRGIADRVFLSAAQCRQLVAVFGDRAFRLEVLTFLILRLSDPQNMKMVASRVAPEEWDELRLRLGTLTLFPFIQPEQHRFAFDTNIPEDRVAACLTVRMNMKESPGRLGNLRQPRLVLADKTEFAFDRGVPATWKDLPTIPSGLLSWQYMAAPEDRSLDMRVENMLKYGGWNVEINNSKVIWWADVQAVPEAVSTFLVHVMRHFKHNLRAAFQMIDGPDGNGKLSLKEFKAAFERLGWREFKDSEKAVELFRYLDPDRGGSISWEEWQVMEYLLKELQLAILELLQYVDRTFGSVEVAYDFLDKDGSDTVDFDEWCQALKSMGYHGPSDVIYKYLCADASTGQLLTLSRHRWDEVKIVWGRREAIYQKILQGG